MVESGSAHAEEEIKPPSLRQQFDMMDFFVGKGLFWEIDSRLLPDIKPLSLAMARYVAFCNVIGTLGNMRAETESAEGRERLGRVMTQLIRDRDKDLAHTLSGMQLAEETDEILIGAQSNFRLDSETNAALDFAVRMGLVGQIDGRNIPAIRALPPRELSFIRLVALRNRLEQLRGLREPRTTGLGRPAENNSLPGRLEAEIQAVEQQYAELMTEYLKH